MARMQFSGTIETVALLLDKNIEYPPRVKRYEATQPRAAMRVSVVR